MISENLVQRIVRKMILKDGVLHIFIENNVTNENKKAFGNFLTTLETISQSDQLKRLKINI